MIYEPQEDSIMLKKQVGKFAKGNVLDVGTGSGILALEAAGTRGVKSVLGTDINPEAIEYCKKNVKHKKLSFKRADMFSGINKVFDTIIFNPPYLPQDSNEPSDSQLITTGGKHGYEILDRFFSQVAGYLSKKGSVLIVFSSLTNQQKVEEIIAAYGFDFKKLSKKKLPMFEELFVYQVTKSPFLQSLPNITNVKKYAKGHRGVVYTGEYKGKTVAIKTAGKTAAINRVANEIKFLKLLNKKGIGPKLLHAHKEFFVMEFVKGEIIWDYMRESSRNQIKRIIRDVFEQCFTMDQMKINKDEMHRPDKHILIRFPDVTLIDFERCRKMLKPKNVTQFCQFLTSGAFAYGLENKGLVINKKILRLAQKYKNEQTRKNFDMILNEI